MRIGAYSLISAEADDGTMPKCAVLDTNVVIDMEHFYFNQTSEEERQSLKDRSMYRIRFVGVVSPMAFWIR